MSSEENHLTVKDVKETVLLLKKLAEEKADENNLKDLELEKLKTQRNEVQVEANSLLKRSGSLEDESNVSNQNVEVMQMQIDHFTKLADENDRWRKEYERKQVDNDERMDEMNSIVKAAYASTESASIKYDEAIDKLHLTNDSIGQLEQKIEATRKLIEMREKEVKEKVSVFKQLQCKSEERSEKESKKEEYINFLRKQVEEAELRAQKAEAELVHKQTDLNRVKNKLKVESDSVGNIKKNLNSITSEFKKL